MESGLSLYVRPYYGAEDIIHNTPRLCIWLAWEDPEKLANVPGVDILSQKIFNERIDIKTGELKKQHKGYPCHLFRQVTQPRDGKCLVIPCTSTGRRKYIPMAFAPERAIISNSCQLVTNAGVYEFGILESLMHMVWMSTVCGRLKSDYRYSRDLCYNTFPWPEVKETQRATIEVLAQKVLDARDFYPELTLADLYDPDKMPTELKEAHEQLDRAVDMLYRTRPFENDEERLKMLFERYEKLVAKPALEKTNAKK